MKTFAILVSLFLLICLFYWENKLRTCHAEFDNVMRELIKSQKEIGDLRTQIHDMQNP